MKRIHKKKMDDAEIKSLGTSHKKQGNKTSRFISKRTIKVIIILFVVMIASIIIYYLSFPKNSNDQNDTIRHFISINGKGNFSSIQAAIDSASDNDIIIVSNGTYFENIKIKKSIKLIGEDKNTTIINGNGSGDVIYVLEDYVNISGFTIKNSGSNLLQGEIDAGIEIRSNYSTISDCNISSNKNFGLYLGENIKGNTIKYNTFFNNAYGIYTNIAKTNNISSNTFTYNSEYGMFLNAYSNDNLISDNIFIENNNAIRIKVSEKNAIIKNLIMNNIQGLYFCCSSKNNSAYNNLFINNSNWHVKDDSGNTWDNGKVGNYWDDYTGTDANGDGIGDTPYLINDDEVDRFPLIEQK